MPGGFDQLKQDVEDAQDAQNALRKELEGLNDQLLRHSHKGGSDGVTVKMIARVKDGAWTNSEMAEGEICIDSSNGRIYFMANGVVHYCSQDA